ncbi:hypothetical protein ACFVGY_12570 [Streptomyces sp. NPDC127106]|uniref:hypothetical protein n=1 Tax=Streptomyces sp. NPDC127106 TaxID=3345360 RepID=UPI0036307053
MADHADVTFKATLYGAAHYAGTAVTVPPDEGNEGATAVAYSLSSLGLAALGSLRAPSEPADLHNPFHQLLQWVTRVTVWEARPRTWLLDSEERGKSWEVYSADTADLGVWASKAKYVRVWKQTAANTSDTVTPVPHGETFPITIVELRGAARADVELALRRAAIRTEANEATECPPLPNFENRIGFTEVRGSPRRGPVPTARRCGRAAR